MAPTDDSRQRTIPSAAQGVSRPRVSAAQSALLTHFYRRLLRAGWRSMVSVQRAIRIRKCYRRRTWARPGWFTMRLCVDVGASQFGFGVPRAIS